MPWPLRTVYYCKIIVCITKSRISRRPRNFIRFHWKTKNLTEAKVALLKNWWNDVWSLLKIETNKTERRKGLYQGRMQRNYKPRVSTLRTKYVRTYVVWQSASCQWKINLNLHLLFQWLNLLRKASHWQLIQNLAPSTIVWSQCDIQIAWKICWNLIWTGELTDSQ